jgi:poly-gamma-glutamate system protein
MKKIYWRPSKVPRTVLIMIAIFAVTGMLSVELFKDKKRQKHYREKTRAAMAMKEAMDVLKKYRERHVQAIDPEVDPTGSGLIGLSESPITSKFGDLYAKQTSINPNWAAVLVEMLKEAGAKQGEVVAMGFSGSFPAINLAALTAAEALKMKVVAITSVTASTWGANIPSFAWLDMERILYGAKIVAQLSSAASLGGIEDQGLVKSKRGSQMLRRAIERNRIRFIEVDDITESIDARMQVYQDFAGESRIAAYINVGGGTVSVGRRVGKRLYEPGLNRKFSKDALEVDSVMSRFAREGIPIIHMVHIARLAGKYGLPKRPLTIASVGEGNIFLKLEYNFYLLAMNLVAIFLILYVFLKSDIGYRVFGPTRTTQTPRHPEPMV